MYVFFCFNKFLYYFLLKFNFPCLVGWLLWHCTSSSELAAAGSFCLKSKSKCHQLLVTALPNTF